MNKEYPIDYITYEKNGLLPKYVSLSMKNTIDRGFDILPLTPDNYDVPNKVNAYHAGFLHIREITIPKIVELRETIKGFFIGEGDLWIHEDFTFNKFIELKLDKPTWLGYKKKLDTYIIGNFLIYIPLKYLDELIVHFKNQKKLLLSDRFFTKLYKLGWLDVVDKTVANEIEHYSNVLVGIRKGHNIEGIDINISF